MFQMVQRHTFMHDGEVWCFSKSFFRPNESPLSEVAGTSRWPTFYVHPETGILCEATVKRRKRWSWPALTDQKWITDSLTLRKLNGLWFECEVMRFPDRFARGSALALRLRRRARDFIFTGSRYLSEESLLRDQKAALAKETQKVWTQKQSRAVGFSN